MRGYGVGPYGIILPYGGGLPALPAVLYSVQQQGMELAVRAGAVTPTAMLNEAVNVPRLAVASGSVTVGAMLGEAQVT